MLKKKNRWIKACPVYILQEDYFISTSFLCCAFSSPYIVLQKDGILKIKSGYSWNGCSPKYSFLGIVIGTPEGEINPETGTSRTYYPSLVHDVLYQLSNTERFARSFPIFLDYRKNVDKLFLKMLKRENFILANLYYITVRIFGKSHWGKKVIQN